MTSITNSLGSLLGKLFVCHLVILFAGGCGYRMGYNLKGGAKTLWVPIFHNHTLRREIEYPLTRAVINRLQVRGGLETRAQREEAAASLVGEIVDYNKTVLSEDSQDRVLEGAFTLTVKIHLIDNSSGKTLVKKNIRHTRSFLVAAGESEERARQIAFENIAEKIVYNLEAWE